MTAGAFWLKVSPKPTQANCLAKTKIHKTAWSMFFTGLYSRYTVPPVIDRTILFPYKCCVFLKVLGTAKLSLNELPLTGANVLSMISGYTPWWILVHPESADFQVGYFPNLEVQVPIFKKKQTLKTLQKLCKCWHPEVKVVLFFVCFFFMFLSRLGVGNCRGEVGEIRRRWQDWRDLYWGCSEGQEGGVWESHLVGDYIPSVGRLYPCYCHLTAAPNLPEELVISDGWKSHQNDLQMFFWEIGRLMFKPKNMFKKAHKASRCWVQVSLKSQFSSVNY